MDSRLTKSFSIFVLDIYQTIIYISKKLNRNSYPWVKNKIIFWAQLQGAIKFFYFVV